jgi:hypothetical protein
MSEPDAYDTPMSTPDPESMGLAAKVVGALAAVGTPIWLARNWLEARFSKKADKEECEEDRDRFQRHIEKLFDNAEKDRAITRELCDRLQQRMDDNHRQVVGIIMGNRNAP